MNEKIYNVIKPYILKNYSDTEINILDILKLFYYDYIIFLTDKFFNNYWFNFKKSLLSYFDKYDVIYFNYKYKNKIINIITDINNIIKNASEAVLQNIPKKIKPIFFSECIFEPDILYKKINFSNQEIFIPFNNYVIKKIEYKLRTFCQIAEKLGAQKIVIDYLSTTNTQNNINLSVDAFPEAFGTNISYDKDNKENIKIIFKYPNNHSDINLNKFYIINSILKENEFLITKEEFESDLELKFLIDARCINFIQKYNTNFIMSYVNKVEQKIFLKAHDYGLNIGNFNLKNNNIKISISIDFIQLQNNLDIIDGTNIHVLREGFIYLSSIIKKNNKYEKIIRFLQSHLNAVEKKWISLNYDYDNIDIINKIYNDIINLNFKEDEIANICETYFKNNLTWYNFKKFRDLILKGSDDCIEKIYFITFQYHDILNNKKYIMNDVNNYINISINKLINEFTKNNNNYKLNDHDDIEDIDDIDDLGEITVNDNVNDNVNTINLSSSACIDFINKHKSIIKNIIYISFKKSFKYNNGLSDNLTNYHNLIDVIKNILIYYFDNDIKKLQAQSNNSFSVKQLIFDKLIENICMEIVSNLNLLDTTPNINIIENAEKMSMFIRIQKIFLKFIIRYFENENIIQKINIKFLNKFIPINKIYKNYNKYKIFYTWDDFNNVRNNFSE